MLVNKQNFKTYTKLRQNHCEGGIMNLQSMENWFLYYALKDITKVEMLQKYRSVNKLNRNIQKQVELDKQQSNVLTQ